MTFQPAPESRFLAIAKGAFAVASWFAFVVAALLVALAIHSVVLNLPDLAKLEPTIETGALPPLVGPQLSADTVRRVMEEVQTLMSPLNPELAKEHTHARY